MGRAPRIDPPGGFHHVTNRGARGCTTFVDDEDRHLFLRLVAATVRRYGIEIHAFALMDNHHHLLVRCPAGGLSTAMQYLGATYTRRFNERHDFDGSLFKGRFHDEYISTEAHLLETSRYIHRNPLDRCEADRLRTDPWSSYGAYIGLAVAPAWLSRGLILGLTGGNEAYARYVEAQRSTDEQHRATSGGALETRSLTSANAQGALSIESVERAVARVCGCTTADIHNSRRGVRNTARLLTVGVAIEAGVAKPSDIARHFGMKTADAASSALRRYRALVSTDDAVAKLRARVQQHLN